MEVRRSGASSADRRQRHEGLPLTFAAHIEFKVARGNDHGVRSISVLFTREAKRRLAVDK
jgi:hypothetical protein